MRTHPADTLNFTFHRFVDIWLGQTDNLLDIWESASVPAKLYLLFTTLLPLLCLLGALYAHRAGLPDAAPYSLVLLIFPLVFYLTHSSQRYRFPMDPIIVVLATNGFVHLWSNALFRGRQQAGSGTPLAPVSAK
jgi:hypothetical protein